MKTKLIKEDYAREYPPKIFSKEEIKILKQVVKQIQEDKKDEAEAEKNSREACKRIACKKCGGIKVHSWITSMIAKSYGKECKCSIKK